MVIFLAGLKQIPQDIYDAAEVDGAGPVRKFFSVTLPLLTPIIFFNFVMQIIGAFQAFTPAYIISGGKGGPADATLFYTLYLYEQAFTNFQMGYASAMAWVLVAIIGLATYPFLSSRPDTGSIMATSAKDAVMTIAVADAREIKSGPPIGAVSPCMVA